MIKVSVFYGKKGYVNDAIINNLSSKGISTDEIIVDNSHLKEIPEENSAVLICLDEVILHNTHLLIYVKDKAFERDLKVYMIGTQEELSEASNYIPENFATYFERPFDIKEISDKITEYLEAQGNDRRKKILAIDDDPMYLRTLKAWLGETYQMSFVPSATSALMALGNSLPDLILLDYQMPLFTGKQVLEMIRSESGTKDIPVIFLSGSHISEEQIIELMPLGIQGYMLKSLSADEIKKNIRDFFVKQKVKGL